MKRKMKKPKFCRQLALGATEEEVRKFELIKNFYCRKSDSDMIRYLINKAAEAAEKNLKKNHLLAYRKELGCHF